MNMVDERARATTTIWWTFRTIRAMQEYQNYNVSSHQSISGEYTRFLIANWDGKGEDSTQESKPNGIDANIERVIFFRSKTAASTTANK